MTQYDLRGVIPPKIFSAIQAQFRKASPLRRRDHQDLRGDEDSLTGAVGVRLADSVNGEIGDISWETHVKKLRGRGNRAPEKSFGADLIIELEVRNANGDIVARKGLLGQSKKDWRGRDAKLVEQVEKMERHAPGANIVIDYTEKGCAVVRGKDAIAQDGHRGKVGVLPNIGFVLADEFMVCTIGARDMYFDANRELLMLVRDGRLVSLKCAAGGRVRTTVYGVPPLESES